MSLNIDSELYFFYEWLILNEDMSSEEFQALSNEQIRMYCDKYAKWKFARVRDSLENGVRGLLHD